MNATARAPIQAEQPNDSRISASLDLLAEALALGILARRAEARAESQQSESGYQDGCDVEADATSQACGERVR